MGWNRVLLGAPDILRGVLQHMSDSYPGAKGGSNQAANPDWLLAELVSVDQGNIRQTGAGFLAAVSFLPSRWRR